VLFHVFAHVEAEELDAHGLGNCLANSVLPTPVGPAKETTDRLFRMAQTGREA